MEGQCRSPWREAPPTHFKLRIESFSTFSTSWLERYESCVFSAGDYKWKLALYPNGNTERAGEDHISLYLVLAENTHSKLKNGILVSHTLLLFDHIRERYYSVQEVGRFDSKKSESGYDKFLPLKNFIDPSNGYLLHDTCIFGTDIFVMENTPKEQCLSMMMSKPAPYKHTWKVDSFSELEDEEYFSTKFTTRGHMWRLTLYPPKGNGAGKDSSLSLYLKLADDGTLLTDDQQVLAQFTLRVVDQVNKNHKEVTVTKPFCASDKSWGLYNMCSLVDLKESGPGYLVDDTCIIEAEVIVLGSAISLT